MSSTHTPEQVAVLDLPDGRDCTRCDGRQHLLAHDRGMGTYRCDDCGMTVGFDLESSPAEFLLSRGTPGRYTRARFGDRILPDERQLQTKA